jgi:formate/nitrite transporter FocA (FNT family)
VIHRKRNKALVVPELIAVALGGMVGGGIFTMLVLWMPEFWHA